MATNGKPSGFNFAQMIAQIGGALSAQGAGGKQGLAQYMATLAKQQSDKENRAFSREATERQQTYERGRDARAHANNLELVDRKNALTTSRQDQHDQAAAGALYQWMQGSPERAGQVTGMLRKTGTLLLPEGEDLNANDRAETMPWLVAGVKGGFTLTEAQSQSEDTAKRREWYATNTGNPDLATTAEAHIEDASKLLTAKNKLAGYNASLGDLERALTELNGKKITDMGWDNYKTALGVIADGSKTLVNQVTELSKQAGKAFVGSSGSMAAEYSLVLQRLNTFAQRIPREQMQRGGQATNAWDLNDIDEAPIYNAGTGGALDEDGKPVESEEAELILTGDAMAQKALKVQPAIDYLLNLSAADAAHLDEQTNEIRSDLIAEKLRLGETKSVSLQNILRAHRDSKFGVNGQGKDEGRQSFLKELLKGVNGLPVKDLKKTISDEKDANYQSNLLRTFNSAYSSRLKLGFPLFRNMEMAESAVAKFGPPAQGESGRGNRVPATEQEEAAFISRVLMQPEHMDNIVTGLIQNELRDGLAMDDFAQLTWLGGEALDRLGIDSEDHLDQLEAAINRAFPGQIATIQAAGRESIQELSTFDPGPLELRLTATASPVSYLPAEDKVRWQEQYADTVVAPNINEDDQALLNLKLRKRFKQSVAKDEQPRGFWKDFQRLVMPRGDVLVGSANRVRIAGDPADEASTDASTSDIFSLAKAELPTFNKVASTQGRVADQAVLDPGGSYPAYSVDTGGGSYLGQGINIPGGHSPIQYAPWAAKGDQAAYIRGDKSLAKQFQEQLSAEEKGKFNNEINILGFFDLINSMDMRAEARNLTPEQLVFWENLQAKTRAMSVDDAYTRFASPVDAVGISFTDLQIVRRRGPDVIDPSPEMELPDTLRLDRADDQIEKAKSDLVRNGKRRLNSLADISQGARFNPTLVTQQLLEDEMVELNAASDGIKVARSVRQFQFVSNASADMSMLVSSNNWVTADDLGRLLTANVGVITGQAKDPTSIEKTAHDNRVANMVKSRNTSQMVDRFIRVYAEGAALKAANQRLGLSTMTPNDRRIATANAMTRELNTVGEKVDALAIRIESLMDKDGMIKPEAWGAEILKSLEESNFTEMMKGQVDSRLLALKLWSLDEQLK